MRADVRIGVQRELSRKPGKRSDEACTQVNLLISETLRRELQARAALEGTDMSAIVEKFLTEHLRPTGHEGCG